MKRQNKKRGFTIIELVIVVAVIAILSAVLIPTFSAVIKRSRESADQSAVRNMNTVLAAESAVEPTTLEGLYDALEENGISAENYKPLYSDRYFFWDKEENVIIYTDKDYNVLYPANQVGNTNRTAWFSLSGKIGDVNVKKDVTIEDNKATVDSAAEFAAVINAIAENNNAVKDVTEIVLPAGPMNLMGAQLEIGKLKKDLTIGATDATKPATIQGYVDNSTIDERRTPTAASEREYLAGMIGAVVDSDVTFKNLVIDGANVGTAGASQVGILVGRVQGKSNVIVDNVKITNTTVVGLQKVGGLFGHITGAAAKVTVTDTTMTDVTVVATQGMAGGLFGMLGSGSATDLPTFAIDNADTTLGNTTVKLNKASTGSYINYERTEDGLLDTTIAADLNDDLTIADTLYENNTCYRYFATCAKYGFLGGTKYTTTTLTGYQNKGVVFAYGSVAATTARFVAAN